MASTEDLQAAAAATGAICAVGSALGTSVSASSAGSGSGSGSGSYNATAGRTVFSGLGSSVAFAVHNDPRVWAL